RPKTDEGSIASSSTHTRPFCQCWTQRCRSRRQARPCPPLKQAQTNMVCLNSRSPSESTSTVFSLDRGRAHLDSSERNLMKEIRELRQKLAARAREGGSSPSVLTLSSVSQ
ncbi:hypothetical protein NQZ68_039950, partial [Dissostichus eleginoides]